MTQARALAFVVATLLVFIPKLEAQGAASLAGDWTLDRAHSEFPSEVGFGASFMPEAPTPLAGGGASGGGRGGRGGGRAGRTNPVYARPDSPDDARRIMLLTDAAKNPPINLTISDASAAVTITADGNSRTFHPTGREESLQLDQVPVGTTTSRVEGHLLIVYKAATGRELRYTYYRTENPTQLVVDATFAENGAVDSIRRVYVPGKAAAPSPTGAPPPSIARPGGPPPAAAPAVDASADGPYRGLKSLAVVVEDLSVQAAACGLTREAIESAATKSLTDAGLTVEKGISSDQNTYLYINVQTSSTTSGLCISRYDAFLYTHGAAQLAYGTTPVLAQVLIAHKGGLAGGTTQAHADSVMNGLKGYINEFTTTITTANK